MSETRHVEHTEHVEHEHEGESETASESVAAATAAAALAETTAAAAEIDAAERVRDYAAELGECNTKIQNLGELMTASAAADAERERILAERLTLLESSYAERLAALESRLPSTPPPSEDNPGTENPGETLIGAEGTATLGPAEASAGASLGGSSEEASETTSPSASRRPRKRWI
jgi:hypothetical protein